MPFLILTTTIFPKLPFLSNVKGKSLPPNVENYDFMPYDLFENENYVYFQQNRAPKFFHANVSNFLDHTFNQRCIGQEGNATEFLPRSPNLTPIDFYF